MKQKEAVKKLMRSEGNFAKYYMYSCIKVQRLYIVVILLMFVYFFSEKGFQPLDIHLIKLVDDSCHEVLQLEETKISSSNRRIRLLGEELRTPYKPFSMPYIIGNNIIKQN